MNKTMINGIDVSECYADNKMMKNGLYCFWEGGNCADNEFCYFKELKRLEQREKALTKIADDLQKRNHDLTLTNEQLEQENEELKAENEQLKKPCLVMPKVNQLAVPIEKYEKLYKALEEIKNLAKPIKENTCFGMYCGFVDWVLEECNEVLKNET